MKRKILIILLSFALIKAQQIILPVLDNFELIVKVSVRDSQISPSGEIRYIYEYTLINSPSSGQPIRIFEIPWSSNPLHPPPYHYQKGDTSYSKLGLSTIPGRACWLRLWRHFKPGDTLSGFVFITKELPDLSDWYAEGIDTIIVFPEVYGLGEDVAEDTLEKIFEGKTPYGPGKTGKTVGPGPLPPGWWYDSLVYFVADSGFYHLIDRVNKCYEQGWLKERAKTHLIRMLERGLRHYQHGRVEQAKHVLYQVMRYLERQRGNLVFDEAFYILYYRTKFVREHLWVPG